MANYIQRSTATSGTVTFDSAGGDVHLVHEAGSLATTLTVAMPTSPVDGMKCYFVSTSGVTALTMSTSTGSIINGLTSAAAGIPFCMMYSSAQNKYYKFG